MHAERGSSGDGRARADEEEPGRTRATRNGGEGEDREKLPTLTMYRAGQFIDTDASEPLCPCRRTVPACSTRRRIYSLHELHGGGLTHRLCKCQHSPKFVKVLSLPKGKKVSEQIGFTSS